MSGAMIPGQTPMEEALGNPGRCSLVSCDSSESTLSFRQLQAELQAIGLNVDAAAPEGTRGAFNAKTASIETKVAAITPQPDMAPDLIAQQTLTNG